MCCSIVVVVGSRSSTSVGSRSISALLVPTRPACGRLLQGTLGAKITDGMLTIRSLLADAEEAAVEEEAELLLGCI